MKALSLFLLGTTLTLSHPLPAEEQHSHDAHEHGHGQLNLALDGQQLLIEFQAPAADLVGFEKTATTAQEKQHYAKALARLRQGATLGRASLSLARIRRQRPGANGAASGPRSDARAASVATTASARSRVMRPSRSGSARNHRPQPNGRPVWRSTIGAALRGSR